MKTGFLMSMMVSGLLAMGAVQGTDSTAKIADDNLIGLTSPNGKLVYDFINMWWNEKKGDEAWDRYVSKDNYLMGYSRVAESRLHGV